MWSKGHRIWPGLSGRWTLGSDKVTEIVLKVTRIVRVGPKPSPTRMCERFARRTVTGIVFLRARAWYGTADGARSPRLSIIAATTGRETAGLTLVRATRSSELSVRLPVWEPRSQDLYDLSL